MLKALVFDVDGTLADTEDTHRAAYNAAFAVHNLPWYWSYSRYARLLTIGGGQARLRYFIRTLRLAPREQARLQRLVLELHETKTCLYAAYVAQGRVPLRTGVARLISEARAAGIALALASSTAPSNVEALLATNLGRSARSWFSVIAGGNAGARRKPAPDIFEFTVRALGLPAARCVAFEDSAHGIAAATAAGIYTVATPSSWGAGQVFSAAQLVLAHLGDPTTPLAAPAAIQIGAPYLGVLALARLQRGWLQRQARLH